MLITVSKVLDVLLTTSLHFSRKLTNKSTTCGDSVKSTLYGLPMFQFFTKPKATPSTRTTASNIKPEPSSSKKRSSKTSRQRNKNSDLPRHSRHSPNTSITTENTVESGDLGVHPLNLPPDERERRRITLANMSGWSDSAELDSSNGEALHSPSSATTPGLYFDDTAEREASNNPKPSPPSAPNGIPPQPSPGQQAESDAEAYKAAGNKFFKAGDFRKAVAEYGRAIAANPHNSTYPSNRSAAYMGLNLYDEALEDAKRSDSLEPGNSKVLLRLARIHTALGRPSEALSTYAQIQPPVAAKDQVPASIMQSYIEQAENALLGGTAGSMILHALDQAERGLGSGVDKPRKWKLMRAEAYLRMGNPNALGDAQTITISLLRSNSQDPDALVLRGRVLYAQGENEKSIQHFRQALNYDPDLKDAVRYLRMVQKLDRTKEDGNIAFKGGKLDEAVRLYGMALEVDPTNRFTNSRILQNRALASIKVCPASRRWIPAYASHAVTRLCLCNQRL